MASAMAPAEFGAITRTTMEVEEAALTLTLTLTRTRTLTLIPALSPALAPTLTPSPAPSLTRIHPQPAARPLTLQVEEARQQAAREARLASQSDGLERVDSGLT